MWGWLSCEDVREQPAAVAGGNVRESNDTEIFAAVVELPERGSTVFGVDKCFHEESIVSAEGLKAWGVVFDVKIVGDGELPDGGSPAGEV
ncbi:MAG TPA: hypothetical protein V6D20_17315, partial [Candidatus Obscuribacterales bacterium]